jgi:hypothetical protein
MAKQDKSSKRNQVDKVNSSVVLAVALSAFAVVFAIIASRALWTKMSYQNRVIEQKEVARDQLRVNLDTVDELTNAYTVFVEAPENVIGGSADGKGERDGDNSKITLDSLPSKYDFPALTTSLEKLVRDNGTIVNSITGIDDEITQQASAQSGPVDMPFELSARGDYKSVNKLLSVFGLSIRPIHVNTINFLGTNAELDVVVKGKSYYQPAQTLEIQKKVVE